MFVQPEFWEQIFFSESVKLISPSCDFEEEDMCEYKQDYSDHQDWHAVRTFQHRTPGTGPDRPSYLLSQEHGSMIRAWNSKWATRVTLLLKQNSSRTFCEQLRLPMDLLFSMCESWCEHKITCVCGCVRKITVHALNWSHQISIPAWFFF